MGYMQFLACPMTMIALAQAWVLLSPLSCQALLQLAAEYDTPIGDQGDGYNRQSTD